MRLVPDLATAGELFMIVTRDAYIRGLWKIYGMCVAPFQYRYNTVARRSLTPIVISHVLRNSSARESLRRCSRYLSLRNRMILINDIIVMAGQEWFFDNDRAISNACSRLALPHFPSCSRTLKQTMDVLLKELLLRMI